MLTSIHYSILITKFLARMVWAKKNFSIKSNLTIMSWIMGPSSKHTVTMMIWIPETSSLLRFFRCSNLVFSIFDTCHFRRNVSWSWHSTNSKQLYKTNWYLKYFLKLWNNVTKTLDGWIGNIHQILPSMLNIRFSKFENIEKQNLNLKFKRFLLATRGLKSLYNFMF
jgi:hypothetical protein